MNEAPCMYVVYVARWEKSLVFFQGNASPIFQYVRESARRFSSLSLNVISGPFAEKKSVGGEMDASEGNYGPRKPTGKM